jgi:hypothetical protein
VTVLGFGGTTGPFQVSVDPAPVLVDRGELTAAQPEVGYPVTAEAGSRVVVEMRRPDIGDPTDPLLRVMGADGIVIAQDDDGTCCPPTWTRCWRAIAQDDDGGVFPHARLTFTHPGGTVTVVAAAFADAYGPYALAVMVPDSTSGRPAWTQAFAPPSR